MVKKNIFEEQNKMKKEIYYEHTGHPSPLNDFRELTSSAYLYIFITFFSQLSETVRLPLPITRAAKVSTFLEEKESDGAPGPPRYNVFRDFVSRCVY